MAEALQAPIVTSSAPVPAGRGVQLLLLTVVASAGIFARTTVGPLQESMRIALSLSDNQMALLQGPALVLPLLMATIPLGLAVDRYSRVRLLFIATALNMVATITAALASSFPILFAARSLVGLAAPATAIAAYSLLADLYGEAQRGRATMVVTIGQVGGTSAAFALGGALLGMYGSAPDGWRLAMLWMGGLLAPVVVLTLVIREPPRLGRAIENPSVSEIWPELWRHRSVVATLVAGMAMVNLADGAAMVWAAPTLSRNFGLPPDHVGAIMAMILLASGILGPIIGGPLADLCQRTGGPRRPFFVLSGLALLSAPAGLFGVMSGVASASVALGMFLTIGIATWVMVIAFTIVMIPNELRGLCMTLQFAVGALFGFGLAPVMVSLLSGAIGGPAMIGNALALVCVPITVLGAALFAYQGIRNPGKSRVNPGPPHR